MNQPKCFVILSCPCPIEGHFQSVVLFYLNALVIHFCNSILALSNALCVLYKKFSCIYLHKTDLFDRILVTLMVNVKFDH